MKRRLGDKCGAVSHVCCEQSVADELFMGARAAM